MVPLEGAKNWKEVVRKALLKEMTSYPRHEGDVNSAPDSTEAGWSVQNSEIQVCLGGLRE